MAHEEQNDPVAQSSMYQRRPPNLEASTTTLSPLDLSERDIKEKLVVKEEETNDTEVFEEVAVHFSYNFNRILQKYKKVKNLLSFFLANLHF